jgi:AraC family transcriptional regulator
MPLPMPGAREILQVLRGIRGRLDDDVSLDALAARAGWSPFHFHRAFLAVTGETPKRYTLRLRLEQAAVRLLTHPEPITTVAAAAGFASHEVFTRAFRRHFHCTPANDRARDRRSLTAAARLTHADTTANAAPASDCFIVRPIVRGDTPCPCYRSSAASWRRSPSCP